MDNNIVPLCLYENQGVSCSYISLPSIQNNKLTCDNIFDCKLITQFYVINPDIAFQPTGMVLFCVKNNNNTTTDIKIIYDPFNRDEKCLRFYAWIQPTPYTTPLYIYKKNDTQIKITFEREYNLTELPFSPIYVLIDPRINTKRINGNKSFKIENNIPKFLFSGYQSRCVPDPDGMSIGDCIVLYNQKILSPKYNKETQTLLSYLNDRYNKEEISINIFSDIGLISGLMLIGIFIIVLIIVLENI